MIGMNIKYLRQEKQMTKQELAEAIGVTCQTVSTWEAETIIPDPSILAKITTLFEISIDELFELPREKQMASIRNMIYAERQFGAEAFNSVTEYLHRLLQNDPRDAEVLTVLAALYNHCAETNREIASGYAERALDADPTDENDAWNEYLEANNGLSGTENAENHFGVIRYIQSFLKKNPDDFGGTFTIIVNLLADFRYQEAEVYIEKLKGHYQYLTLMGNLAFMKGDNQKALSYWEQATKEFPTIWQTYSCLGEGYRKLGMFEKALEAFEKAFVMQTTTHYTDGLFEKAQVHELLGRYEDAIEDYGRIVDVLHNKCGIIDGEEIDFELREIERLKSINSGNPKVL